MTELKMAMIVATRTWSGTSIFDGAQAVLRDIYSPHKYIPGDDTCPRCGKTEEDEIHNG